MVLKSILTPDTHSIAQSKSCTDRDVHFIAHDAQMKWVRYARNSKCL